MPKDGSATREKILETAQRLIMQRGYAGVSIDSIIDSVGITKGAFFYHFKSKAELAKALVKRYRELDDKLFHDRKEQARQQSDDPLESMLIFIDSFETFFAELEQVHAGCLFASYVYEIQQFDTETKDMIRDAFLYWRQELEQWLEEVRKQYPPRLDINTSYLADTFTSTLEGAFVMAKATDDPQAIPQQIRHFRNYIQLLFSQ